ncbi:hypothetical protein N7488_009644 [Penicillium malachiteum]|nr:hypothetical protein N7488_009644 [Penicillium malachiteum]
MATASHIIHNPGTADGWHGVIPSAEFPAERGRYHFYIGLLCQFAHRANFVRHLKCLTEFIDVSFVKPYPKSDKGWQFAASDEEYPGATVDHLFGEDYLQKIYLRADPEYKGRYSVPLLWDTKTGTIESAELLRWLPKAFNELLPAPLASIDLYLSHLQAKIDSIHHDINFGVYKAGFSPTQEVYEKSVVSVFGALNKLERIIAQNGGPFVMGKEITELDIRLYVTLIRFDVGYAQYFKCNVGTIRHDYLVLNNWLKGMYWDVDASRASTNFQHIKENYAKSTNPDAIMLIGPFPDIEEGVERDWSRLVVGGVKHPAVLQYEQTLPDLS